MDTDSILTGAGGSASNPPSSPRGTPIENVVDSADGVWSPGHTHGRVNQSKKRFSNRISMHTPSVLTNNRFYVLESQDENKTLHDACTFKAYRDLKRDCQGEPETFKILRNGTMLLKSRNSDQSRRIERIKTLAGINVKASPHRKLNSSQGTVLARKWEKYTETELCENLAEEQVIDVKRLPSRPNKTYTGSRYLLTFGALQPPDSIRAGLEKLSVRLYIPRPRRCYNCQGFGHVGMHCKSAQSTCHNCAETSHTKENEQCRRPAKCRNCHKDHPASDIKCPIYRVEQEVVTIATKEKVSFQEARKVVQARYPEATRTFAEVTKLRRAQAYAARKQTEEVTELPVPLLLCPSSSPVPGPSREGTTESNSAPRHTRPSQIEHPIQEPERGKSNKRKTSSPPSTSIKTTTTEAHPNKQIKPATKITSKSIALHQRQIAQISVRTCH